MARNPSYNLKLTVDAWPAQPRQVPPVPRQPVPGDVQWFLTAMLRGYDEGPGWWSK
jgi:hypothetical protein